MSQPLDLDEKAIIQRDHSPTGLSGLIRTIVFLPIGLFVSTLSNAFLLLQTITPKVVPLAVCFLFIPLLVFVSLSAGWIVWRNAAVSWEATIYLQYGDGIPPYAEFALPTLVAQQRYDISLHLVIPATESNFALGNFMATLKLATTSNETLSVIRRPAIALPPRANLWLTVPDTIEFDVPLLNSYTPGTSKVLAKVELGRRDGWKSVGNGEGREISVLSSTLRGVIRHHGVRGLVTRFPLFAAAVSTLTFFGISFITMVACILPTMQRRPLLQVSPVKSEGESRPLFESNGDDSSSEQEISRRRRTRLKGRRSEDRSSVKNEELSAIPMPSADSERAQIRRRWSQVS